MDTTEYTIHRLQAKDSESLKQFRESLSSDDRIFFSFLDTTPIEKLLDDAHFFAVFCLKNNRGEMVGYGHLERFSQSAKSHIGRLGIAIHPNVRGKRVSKMVMEGILSEARSRSLSKIWLSVHLGNTKAIRLYERFGFQVEGIFREEELRGENASDVVSMALFLNHTREEELIPWNRPAMQTEEVDSILKVIHSNWLSQGPATASFEEGLAHYTGAKHAIVMNNGTSALLAMFALSFLPGDLVIFPTFTFVSTLNAALTFGIRPILVDIDPKTGNISLDEVEEILKQNPLVKGVVVVDIAGHPVDLKRCEELREKYGITLLEDAAEAIGASCYKKRIGSFDHLAMFSFHAAKLVTTIEGGAVMTNDSAMAEKLRKCRSHGENLSKKFVWDEYGLNFRSTDLQSAIGLAQLEKLDHFVKRRNEIAQTYKNTLNGLVNFQTIENYVDIHPYMMFFILVQDEEMRQYILSSLQKENIYGRAGWRPLHEQPVFAKLFPGESHPHSEKWGRNSLCLPIFNTMTLDEAQRVALAVKGAVHELGSLC